MTDFINFVVQQRTLELLDAYGINPCDVSVHMFISKEFDEFHWNIRLLPEQQESPETFERFNSLLEALDISNHSNSSIVSLRVNGQRSAYEQIMEALNSAPKRFTNYR